MTSLVYFNRIESQGYCPHCGTDRTMRRRVTDHRFQLLLTLASCGLWSVAWLAIWVGECRQPWRCRMCRRKVRSISETPAAAQPAASNTEFSPAKPERSSLAAGTVTRNFRPAPRIQPRFRRAGFAE